MKGMVYLKFCSSPFCRNQRLIFAKNMGLYRSYLYNIQGKEFSIHDYIEILIVIKGKIRVETKYEKIELMEKDIYILNDGVAHITESITDDNIVLVLNIDKNYYYSSLNVEDTKNLYFNRKDLFDNSEEISSIGRELFRMSINEDDTEFSPVRLVDKLVDIINSIVYEDTKYQKNLPSMDIIFDMSKYILNIIEHEQHVDINLEELSKEFNLSYSYLSRIFKRITGLNFTDFILKLRMNKALPLLLNTDIKIIDIAYYSGFQSIKNFNNSFIKVFNISPSIIRENYSDFASIVKNSPIYKNEAVQIFLEENKPPYNIKSQRINLSLANTNTINREPWNEIVDINSIVDLEELDNLDKILQEFHPKKISIRMGVDESNCYLISSKGKKIVKSIEELKLFIKFFDSKNISPILMIRSGNISSVKEFSKKRSEYIDLLLLELLKEFGPEKISEFTFGIELENMDSLIIDRKIQSIENQINLFKFTLESIYENIDYKFAINLGLLDGDLLQIMGEEKNLSLDADYYFLKIDHRFLDEAIVEESSDIIDKLDLLMEYIGISKKESILIYMNYIYNFNFESSSNMNYSIINFFPVYRIVMWIEFLNRGYSLASSNSLVMNEGHLESYYSYFFSNLGIKLPSYYINKLFRQLGSEIIYYGEGKFITKDKEDFIMVIFDDIKNKNLIKNHKMDNKEEVQIKLENIYGVYKITEYKIKYNNKRVNKLKGYDKYLSEEEVVMIENNYSPDLVMDFIKCNGILNYSAYRNLLDVHFISFKKI